MDFSDLGGVKVKKSRFDFSDLGDTAQQPVPPTTPQRSFSQDLASDYGDAVMQGPAAMLAKIPDTAHKIASRGGDILQARMESNGINPTVARAANVAMSYSPDIASMVASPLPAPGTAENVAISAARRALGFSKRFLNTPQSRRAADTAARVALEQNIIPFSGSTDEMISRANKLSNTSGYLLGKIRESGGIHPIDSILENLDSLRSSSPSRSSVVNQKIDRAKELFLGLLENMGSTKRVINNNISSSAIKDNPESIIGSFENPTININPATGIEEISDLGKSPTIVGGGKLKSLLGAMDNSPDPITRNSTIVGGGKFDVMGMYKNPQKFPINDFEKLKKELADSVNWLADNASQKGNKKVVSNIESSIEELLRSSGVDMAQYKAQKRLYGASSTMKKALDNEISAQQGNNLFSLPTVIAASGELASGSPIKAAATLGIAEGLKRRALGPTTYLLNRPYTISNSGSLGLSAAANRIKERQQ